MCVEYLEPTGGPAVNELNKTSASLACTGSKQRTLLYADGAQAPRGRSTW